MSPEQATSQAVLTPASDLYNVGLLLWEMLTGVPRYKRPYDPVDARTLGASPGMVQVVKRALEQDPRRRYLDPTEMARELDNVAALAVTTANPEVVMPKRSGLCPDLIVVPLLALLLAGGVAAGVIGSRGYDGGDGSPVGYVLPPQPRTPPFAT